MVIGIYLELDYWLLVIGIQVMEERLLDSEFLQQLETLSIATRKIFAGRTRGNRRSTKKGFSTEFCDYRPYGTGDDLRYVDWNIFGRLDKLILKLFVEEEDICYHILIDSSASMGFGNPTKLRYTQKLSAALAYISLMNLERVTAITFSSSLQSWWTPKRGKNHIFSLTDFLSNTSPSGITDFNFSMKNYAQRAKDSGVAIIISDFLDEKGYKPGIMALQDRHFDIFIIHVMADEELNPVLSGDIKLIDSETRESKEVTIDNNTINSYRKNLNIFLDGIERYCLDNEIGYMRTSTSIPVETLILKRLKERGFIK